MIVRADVCDSVCQQATVCDSASSSVKSVCLAVFRQKRVFSSVPKVCVQQCSAMFGSATMCGKAWSTVQQCSSLWQCGTVAKCGCVIRGNVCQCKRQCAVVQCSGSV